MNGKYNGVSSWDVENTQAMLYAKRQQMAANRQRREQAPAAVPVKKIVQFDRAKFARQQQALLDKVHRREESYDGPDPHNLIIPSEPVYTHECPECHYMVNETDTHGWRKEVIGYRTRPVPCPVCAPPVKRYQASRIAHRSIDNLIRTGVFRNAANLPAETEEISFGRYSRLPSHDPEALAYAEAFAHGETDEAMLIGKAGRGKSGLAKSAVMEMQAQGINVLFMTMKQYLDLIREDFQHSNDHLPVNIRQVARGVEALVIDDLGVDAVTDFVISETQALIDDRHNAALRTFITCNIPILSPDNAGRPRGLEAYYWQSKNEAVGFQPGERIVSRMEGWYQPYTISGADLRR